MPRQAAFDCLTFVDSGRYACTMNSFFKPSTPAEPHDSAYFHRRAAEARRAACSKVAGEDTSVAGELALAYAALARRRPAPADETV